MHTLRFGIESVYRQGSGTRNEDASIIDTGKNFFAVIDGATKLGDNECRQAVMADQVVRRFFEGWDGNSTLLEAVINANRELGILAGLTEERARGRETKGFKGRDEMLKESHSSCGLAAIRISSGSLEGAGRLHFVQTGDCMLFICYDDGLVRAVTYDHISRFDRQAINAMAESWSARIGCVEGPDELSEMYMAQSLEEIKQEILPILRENRKKMNTPGGYGVLDGSREAEAYLEYGVLNMNHVSKVLLLSDGLQLPNFKGAEQEGWLCAAKYAFRNGLKALEKHVLDMEASDPACYTYPRFKPADDKTGIMISIIG